MRHFLKDGHSDSPVENYQTCVSAVLQTVLYAAVIQGLVAQDPARVILMLIYSCAQPIEEEILISCKFRGHF